MRLSRSPDQYFAIIIIDDYCGMSSAI